MHIYAVSIQRKRRDNMLSLADVLKVIISSEDVEVFDINTKITYDPRREMLPKEWNYYRVTSIYSYYRTDRETYIHISVEEVNNA